MPCIAGRGRAPSGRITLSMTSDWSVIFALSLAFTVMWSWWLDVPPISANPEVIGNPQEIRYEGSGGLILPASVNNAERSRIARCRDCAWKMTPACVPGPNNYCDALIRSCPGLIDHVRTWFRPHGGEWVETGLICLTNYHITTVADVERHILGSFHQYVPPLKPRCWPGQGVVVHLPYICESGQKSEIHGWSHSIPGHELHVSATPHWRWNFDGFRYQTTSPGGPFPNLSVSHTFEHHGEKFASVVSRWHGSFVVGDLGPFPIEQQLEQTRSWNVTVGEARARLISHG